MKEEINEVAPPTGAWIETSNAAFILHTWAASHPLRVRGLKLVPRGVKSRLAKVAPPTGAWIETSIPPLRQ